MTLEHDSLSKLDRPFGRDLEIARFERELNKNIGGLMGLYGIAGIGKSMLLTYLHTIAKRYTDYVIHLDFTPGKGAGLDQPSGIIKYIIMKLEETDMTRAKRRWYQFRRAPSPFMDVMAEVGIQLKGNPSRNIIFAFNSTVTDSVQMLQAGISQQKQLSSEQLASATFKLGEAIRKLPNPMRLSVQVRGTYDVIRPVVILIADTLEFASPEVQIWLRNLHTQKTGEYVYLLAAGRNAIPDLLKDSLAPLKPEAAQEFLEQRFQVYDTKVLSHLTRICLGIPMCLQIAGEYITKLGGSATDLDPGELAEKLEAELTTRYFVQKYLSTGKLISLNSPNDG